MLAAQCAILLSTVDSSGMLYSCASASRAHGYHVLHEIANANALSSPADLSTCVRICNAFDQPGAGKNLVTLYLMYMSQANHCQFLHRVDDEINLSMFPAGSSGRPTGGGTRGTPARKRRKRRLRAGSSPGSSKLFVHNCSMNRATHQCIDNFCLNQFSIQMENQLSVNKNHQLT